MKNLLTIAGSDCSGGAGIQADLKTFTALGTYGMSVITAVTAQNTQGVQAVQNIDANIIYQQIVSVFEDIRVDGIKVGMLSTIDTIKAVVKGFKHFLPQLIVIDPVMVSKSGYYLLQKEASHTLIKELLPLAMVVTPNIPEAEVLADMQIKNKNDMLTAAKKIFLFGVKYVLLKGGHLIGCADDLLFDGKQEYWFKGDRIESKNTHGTGCTLSSALTVNLAKGQDIVTAVQKAKEYVSIGIKNGLDIGKGFGPLHHFVDLYKKAGIKE